MTNYSKHLIGNTEVNMQPAENSDQHIVYQMAQTEQPNKMQCSLRNNSLIC